MATNTSCRNRLRWPFLLSLLIFFGGALLEDYRGTSKKSFVVGKAIQKQFLPSRDRIVRVRHERGAYKRFRDNGKPIEGPNYHKMTTLGSSGTSASSDNTNKLLLDSIISNTSPEEDRLLFNRIQPNNNSTHRQAAKNKKCCGNYASYSASTMCSLYNQDCESGKTKSHDDGDSSCSQEGLSFIGLSFSVTSKYGNPYSYQLCDQFPMENLIDRDYKYIMSMDEDGWLIGGGYKQFDYSGKMPYIDSSHTELLRIGSMDVSKGGTSIQQVYKAMSNITFEPFPIYPEYLKGGGGHKDDNNGNSGSVPSGDITLIVSVVEVYDDNSTYSTYQTFLNELFGALENVNEGSCVDDHDTDPHVSMARGVKFKSSYHKQQYMYAANMEVAVWQAMYPKGVVIGSSSYAAFPFGSKNKKKYVGYGNVYFFFDRMNITKAFPPSRSLTKQESYYATLYKKAGTSGFYNQVNSSDVYSLMNNGEEDKDRDGDNGDDSWEYNPYKWKTNKALHDQTNGWDLTPNCNQEGETFLGIPLSRRSKSNLQSTSTFQQQFNFERLLDRNFTYVLSFGTNHGWLVGGEQTGNGAGSLVDKDTAHIPLFYLGTTNPNMGGMSLSDMVKILKTVQFGTLYIKPAFVFVDNNGHLKLQFEADPYSSLGYLYDNLCQMMGIKWNYVSPSNSYGIYTNCAMHAAGDRAKYGCGPSSANSGGFCPQMTIAYGPKFKSQDAAAAYIANANKYVDYWRSLYPYGVAVGTDDFCNAQTSSGKSGGCLGLFLNRMDLYYVFEPDLSGSWAELDTSALTPTISPAPTYYFESYDSSAYNYNSGGDNSGGDNDGGDNSGGNNGGGDNGGGYDPHDCSDPYNYSEECIKSHYIKQESKTSKVWSSLKSWWKTLGKAGQASFIALCSLSPTLFVAIFIARVRKQQRRALKRKFFSKKRKMRGLKPLMDATENVDLERISSQASKSIGGKASSSQAGIGTNDDTSGSNINTTLRYDPPVLRGSHSNGSAATHHSFSSRKSRHQLAEAHDPTHPTPPILEEELKESDAPIAALPIIDEELQESDQPIPATATAVSELKTNLSRKSSLSLSVSSWFRKKMPSTGDQVMGKKVHPGGSMKSSDRSQDQLKLQGSRTSNASDAIPHSRSSSRFTHHQQLEDHDQSHLPSSIQEENL